MTGLQQTAGSPPQALGLWQESFGILATDGTTIPVHRWRPRGTPHAILVVSHGLAEHALRYRWAAMNLASRGCAVYANDHRGHGQAAFPHRLGDFGHGGFAGLVEDLRQVVWLAATEHPGTPIFLLGHSMGAFAAQLFAIENSDAVSGIAMSGGSALDLLYKSVGRKDPKEISRDAVFSPAGAPFGWLSRDPAVVDRYLDDPLCGFTVDRASRDSFYNAAPQLRDPAELSRIRLDLPVLMLSGERDPINGYLHHFAAQMERYRGAGLRNLTARIYPGARHEVLNETNREEVLGDLLGWLHGTLQGRAATARPETLAQRRVSHRRPPLHLDA